MMFPFLGSVPFYEVGEIRLRSETIHQTTGMSKTADSLIKVSKVDEESSHVGSEEEVMDRLNALFTTLEYLVICEFTVPAGPMRYITELHEFRRTCPGLHFLVKADKLIRQEVARLMRDERSKYPSFSVTLLWVLDHKQHFWMRAEAQATLAMVQQGSPSPRKRPFQSDDHDGDKDLTPSRKERKKQEFLERKKAQKAVKPVQKPGLKASPPAKKPKGKGKGGGSSGSGSQEARPKVPAAEWTAVNKLLKGDKAKFCKFYNTSLGCHFHDDCSSTHSRLLCGGSHGMFECPQRGRQ